MRNIDLGIIPCPPVTDAASAQVAGDMAMERAAAALARGHTTTATIAATVATRQERICTIPERLLTRLIASEKTGVRKSPD